MKVRAIFIIFFVFFLFSCATKKNISKEHLTFNSVDQKSITLLFGGDIMAHKPNFNMKNYDLIWEDVKELIQKSDVAFANIEMPVNDSMPNESYPTFNVHSDYVNAAIKAGFNVFSLANNHSTDHGLEGINATQKWATTTSQQTKTSARPVYYSGLKTPNEDFSYSYFEVNGWKILFIAITEILNSQVAKNYVNYVIPSEKSRSNFINNMKTLKSQNECDLFIISIHSSEPEYVFKTEQKQKDFYYRLIDESGADVIWANHPHVAKEWNLIGNAATGQTEKLIMFANGNTISGQRWEPMFENPENNREYTGDGYLLQATFLKKVYTENDIETKREIHLAKVEPTLITTYIDPAWRFVIKKLDSDFIDNLNQQGQKTWARYLGARKKLMEQIQGNKIWR